MSTPLTDTEKTPDQLLDSTLRPKVWDEYIGQTNTKDNIRLLITAAQKRGHVPEHVLLYGPPGLGKTTLAHLIAHETQRNLKITSGPAIEKVGDLASMLTNLSPGDIVFIDEIHRLNKTIEEVLYPAMESGVLDIVIGKGPSARTIQLELPPFTLLAATTRISLLSAPLRSRFSGGVFRLDFYSEDEMTRIIKRSARILDVDIQDENVARSIALRSRKTPRTANYIVKRCRDFAQVHNTTLSHDVLVQTCELLGIDEQGLTKSDRDYIRTMLEKFSGGPVGLKTIAAATHEEEGTLEDVIEPYLLQCGFIERTSRGRLVTRMGKDHLAQYEADK